MGGKTWNKMEMYWLFLLGLHLPRPMQMAMNLSPYHRAGIIANPSIRNEENQHVVELNFKLAESLNIVLNILIREHFSKKKKKSFPTTPSKKEKNFSLDTLSRASVSIPGFSSMSDSEVSSSLSKPLKTEA